MAQGKSKFGSKPGKPKTVRAKKTIKKSIYDKNKN